MLINTTITESKTVTHHGDFELIRFTQTKNPFSGKWSGICTFAPVKKAGQLTQSGGEVIVNITAEEWDNFWKAYNGVSEIYNIFKVKMNIPDAVVPADIENTLVNNPVPDNQTPAL